MIKEFRVLAISRQTQHYDCDMLRGVFGCNNPVMDAVDTLPPQACLTVITNEGWKAIGPGKVYGDYFLIPFEK